MQTCCIYRISYSKCNSMSLKDQEIVEKRPKGQRTTLIAYFWLSDEHFLGLGCFMWWETRLIYMCCSIVTSSFSVLYLLLLAGLRKNVFHQNQHPIILSISFLMRYSSFLQNICWFTSTALYINWTCWQHHTKTLNSVPSAPFFFKTPYTDEQASSISETYIYVMFSVQFSIFDSNKWDTNSVTSKFFSQWDRTINNENFDIRNTCQVIPFSIYDIITFDSNKWDTWLQRMPATSHLLQWTTTS